MLPVAGKSSNDEHRSDVEVVYHVLLTPRLSNYVSVFGVRDGGFDDDQEIVGEVELLL